LAKKSLDQCQKKRGKKVSSRGGGKKRKSPLRGPEGRKLSFTCEREKGEKERGVREKGGGKGKKSLSNAKKMRGGDALQKKGKRRHFLLEGKKKKGGGVGGGFQFPLLGGSHHLRKKKESITRSRKKKEKGEPNGYFSGIFPEGRPPPRVTRGEKKKKGEESAS